jgi:hypothetical protein
MVSTVDISLHGARVLAQRKHKPESRGTVELLGARRVVPCRVVWQATERNEQGFLETGLELGLEQTSWTSLFNALPFAKPDAAGGPPADSSGEIAPVASEIADAQASRGDQAIIELWSALLELMETKGVFTRDDFIATLRKIESQSSNAAQESQPSSAE